MEVGVPGPNQCMLMFYMLFLYLGPPNTVPKYLRTPSYAHVEIGISDAALL